MNAQTLKYEIIEWVTQSNDSNLLNALKSIKDSNSDKADRFSDLGQKEKDSVARGETDHKNGNVLTSKDFWTGNEK